MKTSKLIFTALFATALSFTSCQVNDDSDGIPTDDGVPYIAPSREDYNNLKDEALEDITLRVDFDAEDGISFISPKGVQVNINGNCLFTNGEPATGPATVEFVEVFDRETMLTANKSTMGVMPNGDKNLLLTGGAFYIDVKQNGESIQNTCNMTLLIPADLTGGPDPSMILWDGTVNEDGDVEWRENDAGANGEEGVFAEGNQYYAYFDEFGWTNVDRFYNDPRPKTTLKVDVPEGYDNTNSGVYLSYDGEENALAQLDTYDENTGLFSEHYGQIPVGLEMHVIFVTEENDEYRWAIQGVTVAENDVYVFSYEETQTGTRAEMVAAIQALP